ncbi:MAG: PepSY domain-containing protein, partial [Armatimonadetes bacterium]|nr:PepSY domain-containing protein [Armatimonadota bacterium]
MAARRLTFRVLLVSTHRWLGLLLGLWLALLGATGSLLAWAPELIRAEMLARDPYHRSRVDQPMIGVTAAHAALQRAQPELAPAEIGLVIVPNYRYPHYLFPVRRHGGVVYKVDPYDGTVHRPYRKSDLLIGRVTEWHENLLLGPRGLLLNGLGSALALVMLVSGLWLWWPATWRAARRSLSVRGGQALPRLLLARHNLLGVASLALVTLVTATAVVLTADT